MTSFLPAGFNLFESAILFYFFLINLFYALFIALSIAGISRHRTLLKYVDLKDLFAQPLVKPITVIAPAYNEEETIVESVRSLLSLEYPVYEVVLVNDGSTDKTMDRLTEAFQLKKTKKVFRRTIMTKLVRGIYVSAIEPKLILVDKINGKKADAMNAGLNVAHYPLFCAIDCDSVIDRDALLKMARPFHEDPERTVAVGGIVRLINGCLIRNGQVRKVGMPRSWLARFQIIEYLRAFLGGRMGLSMLNSQLIISGAFGMFRKDIVLQCGGYQPDAIGEDMDLVLRIRRRLHEQKIPFRISFIPDPVCWTQAPESWKSLLNQRNRWQRGLIQVLQRNAKMIFNPRYGITGLFALPFYLFFEMLSPLIELAGYAVFTYSVLAGNLNGPFALRFFFLAVVLGTLLSLSSIILEEYSERRFPRLADVIILFFCGVMENLGYRQVLALIRSKGFIDCFRGKTEWGAMERKKFKLKPSKS